MRHGGSGPAHYLQCWARRQRARLSKGKEKGPQESPGKKNGMGAEGLGGMETVGWWDRVSGFVLAFLRT